MVVVNQDELIADIQQTIEKAFDRYNANRHPKYVTPKAAMETLGVRISKLQQLRNNDEIRYSMTSSRGIMYQYDSLIEYLDRNLVE
ncbi:MAG: hypothetical protein GKR88_18075 [Flavobacteriaceae bacterium]|nr:MAG: hypothetical protein GKR88_18075 [Flavobacteriaceae bacterium]